jgi:hypothetical protein
LRVVVIGADRHHGDYARPRSSQVLLLGSNTRSKKDLYYDECNTCRAKMKEEPCHCTLILISIGLLLVGLG